MRKPVTRAVCLAVVLLVFVVGLSWLALRQARRPPAGPTGNLLASVTLVGFTNDASGTRLAMFAVTNLSGFAVTRSPKCLICVPTPGRGWMPHSGFLLASGRVLGVGASEIVAIKVPTTESPWRVSLYVSNDVGLGWAGKRAINAVMHFVGRPGPYGAATRQVDSERIEGQRSP